MTTPSPRPMAPRLLPGEQVAAQGLPHGGTVPFTVTVRPANYEIVELGDQAFVFPRLHRRQHIPGVQGVVRRRGPDGGWYADPSGALAARVQQGARVVPHAQVRAFGELMPSYCVGYAVQHGTHHCWAWQRPIEAVGFAAYETDHEAHFAFLLYVQQQVLGHPVPPAHVVQSIRAGLLRELAAAGTSRERNPSARATYDVHLRRGMRLGWVDSTGRSTGDKHAPPQVWRAAVPAPAPSSTSPSAAESLASVLAALPPERLAALLAGLQAGAPGQLREGAAPASGQEPASAPPAPPVAPPAPVPVVAPPVASSAPPEPSDGEEGAPVAPSAPRPMRPRKP